MQSDSSLQSKEAPGLAFVASRDHMPNSPQTVTANSNEPNGVNPFWRIAAVALAIVGFAQFSISGTESEYPNNLYLTASEAGYELNSTLKLGFAETALLSDMTDILTETGGKIINGPSALGLYSVTFETPESCLSAHEKLSSKDIALGVVTLSDCE